MSLLRPMVVSRPAIERNTGRTLTRVRPGVVITEPGEPVSATATRVLAGLTGSWLAQGPGCRPDFGEHVDGCRHQADWFGTSLRALARETFGRDNGSAVAQAHSALRELASTASQVLMFDSETGGYLEQITTLGSVQVFGYRGHPDATVRWAWTVPIREQLMAGHYQRLPSAVVRGLRGSDWRIASYLLQHPGLASMRKNGRRSFELQPGANDRQRFGLARVNRPSKLRDAYERAAAATNELQDSLHIAVLAAAGGGFKFRLTPAATAVASPTTAPTQGPNRADPRTEPRHFEGAIPLEMAPPDGFRDKAPDIADGSYEDPSKPDCSLRSEDDALEGGTEGRPEVALRADAIESVLLGSALAWQPASKKQRAYIEVVESRAIKAGCSIEEHLAIIEEGIRARLDHFEERDHGEWVENDPLSDLSWHDDLFHPRKPVAAVRADGPDDDSIRTAWRQRTTERLQAQSGAWLQELARCLGPNGTVEIAKDIGDAPETSARSIIEFVRERMRLAMEQAA